MTEEDKKIVSDRLKVWRNFGWGDVYPWPFGRKHFPVIGKFPVEVGNLEKWKVFNLKIVFWKDSSEAFSMRAGGWEKLVAFSPKRPSN